MKYNPFRDMKNKAMIIVYLWSLTAFVSFLELGFEKVIYFSSYKELIILMFIPIGGWLGDAYIGRYRMIKYSLRILWLMLVVCELIIIFDEIYSTRIKALPVFAGIGAIASVVVIANSIQFAMGCLINSN